MDRRVARRRGVPRPPMDGTDRHFEEYSFYAQPFEHNSEDDGMGPDRRSTRGGPPGRGDAAPYDMEDDMDDDIDMPPGYAGGRGRDHYHMDDDMDMTSHANHHRCHTGLDADYRMQVALLNHANAAWPPRREGGGRREEYLPATHFMEPGSDHGHAGSRLSQDHSRFTPPSAMLSDSRHGRAGGSGPPRGPNGEPVVEYLDPQEYHNRGRREHGVVTGHPRVGRSSYGRDPGGYSDEDEDSDDEPRYPPSSSRHGHHASAAGRGGRSRR